MLRNSKWKLFSTLLIVCGLGVLAYPYIRQLHQDAEQKQMLYEWQTAMDNLAVSDVSGTAISAGENVIGVLRIDAIDLEQPIQKSASLANLAITLCTMEPTGEPGKIGTFAVAGHNSRIYGRHFNRLNEVKTGNEISVETKDGEFFYQVTKKQVIEPTDTWVLEQNEEEPAITLITCYYPGDGTTKRLAVMGVEKKDDEKKDDTKKNDET